MCGEQPGGGGYNGRGETVIPTFTHARDRPRLIRVGSSPQPAVAESARMLHMLPSVLATPAAKPWMNPSDDPATRAKALLGHMNLTEKLTLFHGSVRLLHPRAAPLQPDATRHSICPHHSARATWATCARTPDSVSLRSR